MFAVAGGAALTVAAAASLFVGVSSVSFGDLVAGDAEAATVFWTSRVPRMFAVVLAGSSISVAGLVMQALTQNRFVSPSTAGTVESATLGIVGATIVVPAAPLGFKMLLAVLCSLAGTAVFLAFVRRLRVADPIYVPLTGIMIGAVVSGITVFLAYRFDLLQSLVTWTNGDFSGTLRGRYELLWIVAATSAAVVAFAHRFTVAGLGRDVAVGLGVDHGAVVMVGLALVSVTAAVVVVVVGAIPLLGLVVPNLVTLRLGDHLARVVPATAVGGALFLLVADVASRTIRSPYEVPVGAIVGVVGGATFVVLLLRERGA